MQNLFDRFAELSLSNRLAVLALIVLVAMLINPLSKILAAIVLVVAIGASFYQLFRQRSAAAKDWARVAAGAFLLLILLSFFPSWRL